MKKLLILVDNRSEMSKLFLSNFLSKNYDNYLSNSLKFTAWWLISRYSMLFTQIWITSNQHQIFVCFQVPNTYVDCLL